MEPSARSSAGRYPSRRPCTGAPPRRPPYGKTLLLIRCLPVAPGSRVGWRMICDRGENTPRRCPAGVCPLPSASMADGDASPDTAGHRARLRERLLARGGGDALLDHELIEYLLALAIPRRDTKPLAKALLREFGGIGGLLTADAEALTRIPGMGETATAAIKIAHAAALRLLHGAVAARPVLGNWQ